MRPWITSGLASAALTTVVSRRLRASRGHTSTSKANVGARARCGEPSTRTSGSDGYSPGTELSFARAALSSAKGTTAPDIAPAPSAAPLASETRSVVEAIRDVIADEANRYRNDHSGTADLIYKRLTFLLADTLDTLDDLGEIEA